MNDNILIPGATSTDSFTLPVDASIIQSLHIDYSQEGTFRFSKTKEDCSLDGTSGTVELTQEDTLKFVDGRAAQVQIVLVTMGGEVIPSKPITFSVGTRLNREVL